MVFCIVLALTFIVSTALIFGKSAWGERDWLWLIPSAMLATLATTCAAGVAMALIYAGTSIWSADVEHDSYYEAPIVSLNDGQGDISSLHGTFFLGIGGVSGGSRSYLSYTWYERLHDGSLRGRMILDDGWNDVRIYEDCKANQANVYEITAYTQIGTPHWLFPGDIHEKDELVTLWQICVPKGTVVHGFTLDGRV